MKMWARIHLLRIKIKECTNGIKISKFIYECDVDNAVVDLGSLQKECGIYNLIIVLIWIFVILTKIF